MNKIINTLKSITALLGVVCVLSLNSCKDEVEEVSIPVSGISLNLNELKIQEGVEYQLTPSITPEDATNKQLKWSVSELSPSDCIEIDTESGKINPIKAGTAVVTVTTVDGGYTAKCNVEIVKEKIPVESITIPESQRIAIGDKYTFEPIITPEAPSSKKMIWSLSDVKPAGCLTIDEDGTITGVAVGTAIVNVKAADGRGANASCKVEILEEIVEATGVELNYETLQMNLGDAPVQLKATITPENAVNTEIVWEVVGANPNNCISLNEGLVTAMEEGTAKIKVTVKDTELSDECTVTVKLPAREGSWSDKSEEVSPEGNIYKVTNGGQLYFALKNMKDNQTVQLQNDINLFSCYWSPVDVIGSGSTQAKRRFIDGNGFSIKGLCVDASKSVDYSKTFVAFFGEFKHALVYDLNFVAPEIITNDKTTDAAVVVAKGNFAGVYNCKITDAVISADAGKTLDLGGIAADVSNGFAVAGCLFQGSVHGTFKADAFGGLIGFAGKSMIVASIVDCNYDIDATNKGLFLARSGAAATAPNRIIGCYYAGSDDVSSLKFVADRENSAADVIACSNNKFEGMAIEDVNQALNGEQGYAATTIGGVANVNCILLQLDNTYKYNYINNSNTDKEKYPYIVDNIAK